MTITKDSKALALGLLESARDVLTEKEYTTLHSFIGKAPPAPADGWEIVMVPKLQPEDEPDWDECVRQAELATGLRVERNTLSIVIREVRRWLAGRRANGRSAADALALIGNCRRWTREMDRVWHQTIPDVAKAFEHLAQAARKALEGPIDCTARCANTEEGEGATALSASPLPQQSSPESPSVMGPIYFVHVGGRENAQLYMRYEERDLPPGLTDDDVDGPLVYMSTSQQPQAAPVLLQKLQDVAQKARAVAYSNGFDAALSDKKDALRTSLEALGESQ